MAQKTKPKRREADSVYILKIVLYFILGTIWIKYERQAIFPLGFAIGILFASHDHFRIDRKVEYALLLLAAVLGLMGLGIFINL
jgi:hypothetical protein